MEVYHASTCIIEKPDTLHSRQFLDFGPGFYITTMYDQAEKYAARFVRRGKQAFINIQSPKRNVMLSQNDLCGFTLVNAK